MSIGTQLRAAREARGASTSEAAAATRMKVQHIEALEREEFSVFAAPIYARGFLRTYAAYLGISPDPLLKEYAARYPAGARPPIIPATAVRPSKRTEEKPFGGGPAAEAPPPAAAPSAPPPAAAPSVAPPAAAASADLAVSPAETPPARVRANGEMEFAFDAPTPLPSATPTAPPEKPGPATSPAPKTASESPKLPPPSAPEPLPTPAEKPEERPPKVASGDAPHLSDAPLFEKATSPPALEKPTRTKAPPPASRGARREYPVGRIVMAVAAVLLIMAGLIALLRPRARRNDVTAIQPDRGEGSPLLIEAPPEPMLLDPFASEPERRARP